MKKLLIATDNFLPRWDGVSRFLSEIVPQLESLFDITIMSPKFKGDLKGWENRKLKRFDMTRIKVGDIVLAWPNHDEMKKLVADADIVWVQTLGPIGGFAVLQEAEQASCDLCPFCGMGIILKGSQVVQAICLHFCEILCALALRQMPADDGPELGDRGALHL